MKNLILISSEKNQNQFDNIEELKNYMLGDISRASAEDQEKYFYEKVFGFCAMNDLQIVQTKKGAYGDNYKIDKNEKIDLERAIIVDNFDTYVLSLCKFNAIVLLEEKDHRNYTKNIDIELNNKDNYIIVNSFANQILKQIVGDSL